LVTKPRRPGESLVEVMRGAVGEQRELGIVNPDTLTAADLGFAETS
jgi:hypothetical protein